MVLTEPRARLVASSSHAREAVGAHGHHGFSFCFNVDAGDLSSDLQTCTASTLPAESTSLANKLCSYAEVLPG